MQTARTRPYAVAEQSVRAWPLPTQRDRLHGLAIGAADAPDDADQAEEASKSRQVTRRMKGKELCALSRVFIHPPKSWRLSFARR